MTLPVSSYEELLARVRSLTTETIQLRREITSSLSDHPVLGSVQLPADTDNDFDMLKRATLLQRRTSASDDPNAVNGFDFGRPDRSALLLDKKENEIDNEYKEIDEKVTSPDTPVGKNCFSRSGWPPDSLGLWRSGPSSLNLEQPCNNNVLHQDLTSSAIYNSKGPQSLNTFLSSSKRIYSHQQLGAKVEMVYSLLSMLDVNNGEDMSKTFLAMSSSPESCHAMRQSGCLPLLIQLIHSSELNREVRERAAQALHNIVHSQTDEKRRKREVRVLKLLQQVREYCDELKNNNSQEVSQMQEPDKHPINAIGTLMKFSFDAEHRQAICILGGLHAISELIQVDYEAHGNATVESVCITLRRYAGMSLTNLTFGDCKNKALLCSFNKFMFALVNQLKSPCEDLRQVTASVLRNLSWRADSESKQALRDVGAVTALTLSVMEGKKESTLKSILSALWNLSAHCSLNKVDICSVPGALAFLVKMLKYKSSSNTLAIVENAGGILRNISSHIAVREDYRQILRENNCFEVLLEQLKSPSLTVVSNACGTLWNLSARCTEDQRRLWEMGATSMLRSLVQSKHKMISMGSSAALKNLLAANPNENLLTHLDSTAKSLGLQNLPTLFVRKKRALEQELNITLAETCDNIDSIESPTRVIDKTEGKKANAPRRSESRDSVQSTQSDSTYERINQISLKNEEKLLENKNVTLHDSLNEKSMPRKLEDQKLMKRYKSSMIPTPTFKKVNQDRINEKTREEQAQGSIESEPVITDLAKEAQKIGIPGSSSNIRINQSHFANNSFSQSVEESLVKHKENESGQVKSHENVNKSNVTNSVLNSVSSVKPDLNRERNTNTMSNSSIESGFVENVRGCERIEKNGKEHENVEISKNLTSEIHMPNVLNVEKFDASPETVCDNYIPEEFEEKVNESASDRDMTECSSFEALDVSKTVLPAFQEQSSQREGALSVDFPPKGCVSEDFSKNVIPKTCPEFSEQSSKDNSKDLTSVESDKITKTNFLNQKHPPNRGEEKLIGISPQSPNVTVEEIRHETPEAASHVLVVRSPSPSHQSFGLSSLEDRGSQNQKGVCDAFNSSQAATGKLISFSSSNIINATEVAEPKSTGINFPFVAAEKVNESTVSEISDELETSGVRNVDGVHVKSLNNVLPKFKVGSPMTDSKVLQMEANKICHEIKKHQDFEMGCSLTSEVSLVSCSSFIDTGDYSLFDSSTDVVDFDEMENLDFSKVSSRFRNLPLRRPATCLTTESDGLPSLSSLKNEQIDALDLDSSILSVASITSEVAETYSKDFENFQTYTKTYNVDVQNEHVDDTVADATLVSNGEDTLNADSLQNNPELFDDDNSLHSQENLPLDVMDVEESTRDRIKKKLTPKERRKTFHERYRTYTIRDFNGCKASEQLTSGVDCQGLNVNASKSEPSVSRTQHDNKDRHTANVLEYYCVRNDGEVGQEEGKLEASTRLSCDNSKHGTLLFSKKLIETQGLIPEFAAYSKTVNDVMNIGPAERKELVDNAKLVAFSLKTAVHDYDVISDCEAEDPHVDFDTATYSKNFPDRYPHTSNSPQGLNCLQHDEVPDEEDPEKRGARIFKPNVKSIESEKLEEPPKGIRGRRKALYSSPQKHSQRTVSVSKASQTVIDAKKSLPLSSMPPMLRREGTFTKEDGPALKKNENKNVRTIPVFHRNMESKNASNARAVSGNKSGPLSGTAKRNGEGQVSKTGRPQSTYTTKANERRLESDCVQRRSFSAETGNRAGGDGSTTSKRATSTGLTSPKMGNSSSNQNVKTGNAPGSGFLVKSKNPGLQNLKSQSDANLNLVAITKDKGKQKTPKKEVTSKIASLWRKVEETKQKNKTGKDNRVWICSKENTGIDDEVLVVEQEEILDIPTRRIVHSVTCQALSDEACTNGVPQGRNSRTLEEFAQFRGSEEKREKTERRNIISAIVPPYNYSPPVSEKSTPLRIKQVDTFQKGSLKVTTV